MQQDKINLHQIKKIKKKLNEMLKVSGRFELAMDCFAFILSRELNPAILGRTGMIFSITEDAARQD